MKFFLLICSILFVSGVFTSPSRIERTSHLFRRPPPSVTKSMPKSAEYFTQKLDHFDSSNEETWKQKYFVNTDYFNTEVKNVAFLLFGGAQEIIEEWNGWMAYGPWAAFAKKYGAIMFHLEHRFYGDSQPCSELTVENLKYLSSEQALADAANFIEAMNEEYLLSSDVKWIAFGGSYSGSLAAWFRLKYPELVHGAVSSSAPLLAKLDFSEYFQVVIDDVNYRIEGCVSNLKAAMEQIDNLIDKRPTSAETVTNIFNLCDQIEYYTGHDVEHFYNYVTDIFAALAQNSEQGGTSFDLVCDILINYVEDTEIRRLGRIVKAALGDGCLGFFYADDIAYLNITTVSKSVDRQWHYQTCTEFGWYRTTNREDKVFGQGCGTDYYTSMCNDLFGFNETYINEKIEQTNANYGGTSINATNVVYVYGSLDPWHAVGLQEATNPESPVIYIEGTSHCADMYDADPNDFRQLTAARDEVDRLIGVWLGVN